MTFVHHPSQCRFSNDRSVVTTYASLIENHSEKLNVSEISFGLLGHCRAQVFIQNVKRVIMTGIVAMASKVWIVMISAMSGASPPICLARI